MTISCIYQIKSCLKPERIYIGSTENYSKRQRAHINDLRANRHRNIILQRHFNKYGEKDLFFTILCACDKEYLFIQEQFFIDALGPYFNICKSTMHSRSGIKMKEDDRIKLSEKLKGKRTKENNPFYGKHHTDKTKELLRKAQKEKRFGFTKGYVPWNKGIKMSEKFCKDVFNARLLAEKEGR